jgi:hypothetical protein
MLLKCSTNYLFTNLKANRTDPISAKVERFFKTSSVCWNVGVRKSANLFLTKLYSAHPAGTDLSASPFGPPAAIQLRSWENNEP